MQKGYVFPELTDSEKERIIEIKFYIIVRTLAQSMKDAYNMYDYIELLARVAKCNTTVLKGCVNAIADGRRTLTVPNKTEVVVMLYRADYSISDIARILGMHSNTVRKHLAAQEQNPYQYPMRFSTVQRIEIEKFVQLYLELHPKI